MTYTVSSGTLNSSIPYHTHLANPGLVSTMTNLRCQEGRPTKLTPRCQKETAVQLGLSEPSVVEVYDVKGIVVVWFALVQTVALHVLAAANFHRKTVLGCNSSSDSVYACSALPSV